MKKTFSISALALLLAAAAQAQNPLLPPGKIAVFKAGDNTGIFNISVSKVQPCFVQVFDTATNNQASPWVSVTLPTNAPNGIWINAHAGSEGGGISRTINRQFLALEGYTGNILSPAAAKPSSDPTVNRGLGTLDAFGTEHVIYQDLANWFGMPPGITQNNPTGIASTDGTNFWGTGNVTGTSSEAAGTLFYNANVSPTPEELQNFIQAANQARIIGGTLYIVVSGQGVYNFLDPENNDAVVPLPWDPNVPNPVQHPVLTNLFLNWGSTFSKVAAFDMNAAGTIAYGADQTKGIVKFTNNGSGWSQAYFWGTTNLGTKVQASGNQGCFGICVDFSGSNEIIYATTMENGTVPNAQGNINQNRLIRIVDTNVAPVGTVLLAQTLASAQTTNEAFHGIDFTPDLSPLITFVTAGHSTTNGGSATYTVQADSVYPLSYQWLTNGVPLVGATSSNVTLSGLDTTFNGYTLQCVVTNQYGMVTSTPASTLTVTASPTIPSITNSPANVSAFVSGEVTFAPISPTGTEPFTYQWYHGATQLMDDGIKYVGSTSNSLTISNLVAPGDGGNYILVASNSAGFASNIVDVLTVQYHTAVITAGDPAAAITFVGYTTSLIGTSSGGSAPITNQWYRGATATTVTNLVFGPDFSGTNTDTLTISPAALADAGFYKIVVSNPGGSVTSAVAQVTVLVPPAHSQVSYSNQVYAQTFDSLPDPGSNSVNSINNPMDPGSINGVSYSLANPFDFAFPVVTGSFVGGLGLSNTMPGWYGAADTTFPGVDGISRFGAQDGDQTTGGIIDFGLNDNSPVLGTNRALGLMSTATTGSTTMALKLVNTSGTTLNYVSLGFLGELWRNSTGLRTMSFGYTLDNSANTFVLSAQSISNATTVSALTFSFPTNAQQGVVLNGALPANQTNLNVTNLALNAPWPNGGALWLIWGVDFFGAGQGNGYGIDNLYFYASANQVATAVPPLQLNVPSYVQGVGPGSGLSLSFTNVPSAFFTVYYTTNLTAPVIWKPIGAPTEVPNIGFSTYQFNDPQNSDKTRFYKIATP
jgi:hypothetical protein